MSTKQDRQQRRDEFWTAIDMAGNLGVQHWHRFTQEELESTLNQCGVRWLYCGIAGSFNLVVCDGTGNPKEYYRLLKDQINCGVYICCVFETYYGGPGFVFRTLDTYKVFPKDNQCLTTPTLP